VITFKQFLAEAENAGVYVKGPLNVISSLIKDKFSLDWSKISMTCLAAQFVFALEAATDLPAQQLVWAGERNFPRMSTSSATFEQLFNAFNNKPLKLRDGRVVTFKLSSHSFTTQQAIEHVKQGIPSVMVVNSDMGDWGGYNYLTGKDENPDFEKTGQVSTKHVRKHKIEGGGYFHALLLVGYDEESKELILRESRSSYGFKGYLKIPAKAATFKHTRFIATIVDSYKIKDPKPSKNDDHFAQAA